MARMRLNLESLLSRTLPSATLVNGVLTIEGTSGRDTIVVTQTGSTLSVRGEQIDVNGTLVDSVDLADVARISIDGRGGNDTISVVGVSVAAHIRGGGGNDDITGGSGDDRLNGGTGRDTCRGGRGNDHLVGFDGDDTLGGGAGDDTLIGGRGDDRCNGGSGNDDMRGQGGDDNLLAGDGDDRCNGGGGDDRISGGRGRDDLSGGGGNDDLLDLDEDLTATSVEGRITAIDLGQSTVTITTVSGVSVTVKVVSSTKLERNDIHVSLAAFQLGDRAEADFNTQRVASKLEAE